MNNRWRRLLAFALVGGLLGGCAAGPDWRVGRAVPAPQQALCLRLLGSFDTAVAEAGVFDAAAARLDGFPYLRTDRFLASFDDASMPPDAHGDWVGRLRDLDREARRIEAANLPSPEREALSRRFGVPALAPAANACGDRLAEQELLADGGPARTALHREVVAPRHYLSARRVLGLYPLTRIGLAVGYNRWKESHLDSFATPLSAMPAEAPLEYYAPAPGAPTLDAAGVAALLREAPRSPLGIVEFEGDTLQRLAAHFAPVFAVETASNDDRFGAPYWRAGPEGPRPAVDTSQPVADVRLAHTRFDGAVLPQLVYTLWFPARTRQGALDILGGRLDGLVWRVTLSEDGEPLIHDSIHPCGCYHLFFPVPPVRRVAVPQDRDLREAPLTPKSAPRLAPDQRLRVRVAATSHYVLNLGAAEAEVPEARAYALRLVDEPPAYGQRSLALPGGGRRSLYGPDGLVPHTQRLERFLLWPAGILSPGAMREWGTHATVFVGERHFDDPYLFDAAFERPGGGPRE